MTAPTVRTLALMLGIAAAAAACGERSQRLDASARKPDTQAWAVSEAATPAYAASGWKAGDKAAWEEQLRRRNQAQNDYVR